MSGIPLTPILGRAAIDDGARPIDGLIAALIGVLTASFFISRILASIAAGTVDNGVFGADHAENLRALADGRVWGLGYAKHFGTTVWAGLTVLPLRAIGLSTPLAAAISFGGALGLGHAAQYLGLRLLGVARAGSAALVLLALAAFSFSTAGSVVDIYGLSVASSFVALYVAARFAHAYQPTYVAGIAAGITALFNSPTAAYAMTTSQMAALPRDLRQSLMAALRASIIGVGFAAAPLVGFGLTTRAGTQQAEAVREWASIGHFFDPAILSDYLATLTAFVFVAPGQVVQCRYLAADLAAYLVDPVRGLVLAGWWALILGGIAVGLAAPGWRKLTLGALSTTLAIALFYTYFAPQAAQLFAVQLLPATILLIAPLLVRYRRIWVAALLVAAGSAVLNWPALSNSPVDDFAEMCPAHLTVNGAL